MSPSTHRSRTRQRRQQRWLRTQCGTAVLLQSGAEQLQLAKMTANNAVVNNRQLHVDERVLARNLAAKSGGKFTVEQIENALRNSGNTAKGEGVDEGMVVRTEEERYDKGAVFDAGEQGSGAIVQELPNQGKVNADLASFIVANTGGSSSPYGWLDGQLGKAQPVASNPNAGLNTFTPAANGCASAECAGGVAGVKNAVRDGSDIGNDAGVVGTGATFASLIAPVGLPGAVLTVVGAAAGLTEAVMSEKPTEAVSDEVMKTASGKGGEVIFKEVLGHTPGAAARASALIELSGGWDAFVNRVKIDLLGMTPNDTQK